MTATRTAEHVLTNHNLVTIDASIPVSFVDPGANADGIQNASLATGPGDGFEKVICYGGGLAGCSLRVRPFAMVGGDYAEIPEDGGSATFRYNASTTRWQMTASTPGVTTA